MTGRATFPGVSANYCNKGIDQIDADACKARHVKIFNTPGVNAQAVAETVLTHHVCGARIWAYHSNPESR